MEPLVITGVLVDQSSYICRMGFCSGGCDMV
jgi:hypothetical protein